MTKRFCTLLFLGSVLNLFSQNIAFDKNNFPNKDELKDALKKMDQGAALYFQGRQEFDEHKKQFVQETKMMPLSLHDYHRAGYKYFKNAIPTLQEAFKINRKNANLNYMLGFMLLFQDPLHPDIIPCLEHAAANGQTIEKDVDYWLAWALHLNSRWEDAVAHYEAHRKTLNPRIKADLVAMEDIAKKIEECLTGKKLSAFPERVFVDNLGPGINTAYPEYGPTISTDESTIFFTSRRSNSMGGKRDQSDNAYFEDLYTSTKQSGKWLPAKQLSKNVNTEGHDAVAGLSADGSKLYLFRSTPADGGDLYQSNLAGTDWEPPVRLNKNINTRYHESTVSLSYDGKRLFFVSRKDMGFGGSDIYYSDLDANGEWGPSKNAGPDINTKYPEDGAFMHPDGVTLYFSSKGHGTMGGYDIFKSTLVNGKWQKPVNLGYPINGPDDDVFFVVSGSGNRAYFASNKSGGYGDHDIYKITFLGPEKQPLLNTQDQLISLRVKPINNYKLEDTIEVKSARLTLLKGNITDEKTGKPVEASIDLVDNEKNELLAVFRSNSSTGKYLVTLPSGRNYGLAVKAPGYLFHSENFQLPELTEFQEFVLDISLQKLEVGSIVVLRNIFFDSDKSNFKKESEPELERLVKLLHDNPAAKIEISSHTDNQGSTEYNQKLSDQRSLSVVAYLKEKGIPDNRLVAKGYGETAPVSRNDTEAGRQSNRRTEFKILSK